MNPSAANAARQRVTATSEDSNEAGDLGRVSGLLAPSLLAMDALTASRPALSTNAAILESLLAQEQRQRALLLASARTPLASLLTGGSLAQQQPSLFATAGLSGLPGSIDQVGLSSLGLVGGLNAARASLLSAASLAQPTSTTASLLLGQQQAQAAALRDLAEHQKEQMILDAMEQRGRKGRTGTFPQKLHQMLSDLESEEGGTAIASYLPHGRAFAIHKPNEFVKRIMPKYFRMSRFSSFQRQLNLYEFVRVTDGPDKGAYYHELFMRGRPILASQIRRNKIKGGATPETIEKGGVTGSSTTDLAEKTDSVTPQGKEDEEGASSSAKDLES